MPLDIGDPAPLTVRIYTDDEPPQLIDTTTVNVIVTLPDGTTSAVLPMTRASLGVYEYDFPTTMPGLHQWAATATGAVEGVFEDAFTVTAGGRSLVSVDEAVEHLRGAGVITKPADRERLRWLCQVATDAVERDLGRILVPREFTEVLDGGRHALVLTHTPVLEVLSVDEDGVTVPGTGYWTRYGLLYRGTLGARGCWSHAGVTVTYRAGDLIPPPVTRKVALNGVQRMWQASAQVHPDIEAMNSYGAVFAAAGSLTPLEMGAYQSLRQVGIA